ncbi:MAG: hypothetical protein ABW148_16415 [Sedimenticola sp.]
MRTITLLVLIVAAYHFTPPIAELEERWPEIKFVRNAWNQWYAGEEIQLLPDHSRETTPGGESPHDSIADSSLKAKPGGSYPDPQQPDFWEQVLFLEKKRAYNSQATR